MSLQHFLKSKNKKESLSGNVMVNKARHYPDEIKKELDSIIKLDINSNLVLIKSNCWTIF